jgi:hypothetical protein
MTVPEAATRRHAAGGGVRRGALVAYRWVLAVLLVDVVVQFFLAGLGVFGGGFDAHVVNSIVVSALAFLVLVLAVVAHVGTRDVALAAVLLVLVGLVQSVFRGLADEGAFWGGLHALDGLVILGIAGFLHGTAIRRIRSTPRA